MKNIFRTRWRVVTDSFCGYEVQYRYWWSPRWLQAHEVGGTNTHTSLERAIAFIKKKKGGGVVYED